MKLNKAHINEVEHNIAPPMAVAITLPVEGTNVVVYVAASGFCAPVPSGRELKEIAKRLHLADAGTRPV